jgi:hypothetical protein
MPESVINSSEVEEHRRALSRLRRAAIQGMQGAIRKRDEDRFGLEGGGRRRLGGMVKRVRVRRFRRGVMVEEDVELESEESSEEGEQSQGWYGQVRGKKKKRKDVWVGASFDIGREFVPAPELEGGQLHGVVPEITIDRDSTYVSSIAPSRRSRPTISKHSTQETFVTARTQLSGNAPASTSSLPIEEEGQDGYHLGDNAQASSSRHPLTRLDITRHSQSSSMQPLIPSSPIGEEDGRRTPSIPCQAKAPESPSSRFRHRLKSAIRNPSESGVRPSTSTERMQSPHRQTKRIKAKTVQFPIDLVQPGESSSDRESPRKGNKKPVDPGEVLSREGEEVAGTSAGAVEDALEENESDDDDVPLPGAVIMRGKSTFLQSRHH